MDTNGAEWLFPMHATANCFFSYAMNVRSHHSKQRNDQISSRLFCCPEKCSFLLSGVVFNTLVNNR